MKVQSLFIDNIWCADLADMQLIIHSLCVFNIFSKCSWAIPLKDEKGLTITNAFQKILDESDRKPNKIWVLI